MHDTSPDAEVIHKDAILRIPPAERIRQVLAHSDAMRELMLAPLRRKHPEMSTLELVELLLGRQLMPRPLPPTGE